MNQVTYEAGFIGVVACAGYLSAWFAAGPRSSLRDPRLGALLTVSMRITDLVVGRQLVRAFPLTRREGRDWELKEVSARFALSATVTIVAMNCLGIPLGIDDINVLTIGAAFGVPCSLVLGAAVLYLYND